VLLILKKEVLLKRFLLLSYLFLLAITVFSQQIAEEAVVINIEVPVRVFQDGIFIENLSLDDFEILEDGTLQRVEAVYLIKKRSVERSEEKKRYTPTTTRSFFLFFEISEYTPEIGDTIDYFYENVLSPGDNLIIVTPMKTYKLRNRVMEHQSKQELSKQLKDLLRNEALIGNAEYRGAVQELIGLAKSLSAGGPGDTGKISQQLDEYTLPGYGRLPLEKQLMKYLNTLERIEKLRQLNQQRLLDFAKVLKKNDGQKFVFLIYQREFIPQIDPSVLDKYIAQYEDEPHILYGLYDLFETTRRDISFDVNLVKQTYADSSISIHFLFLTPPIKPIRGVYFQERSEDIYGAFKEMADATGGFIDSSSNAVASFKKAVHASENYYLLYYSPQKYEKDGKFREIVVRIKEKDYKVVHRQGYFAN